MHGLDLIELGVEVPGGLVGVQVVDDAAQPLQTRDIDAASAHLGGLGAVLK